MADEDFPAQPTSDWGRGVEKRLKEINKEMGRLEMSYIGVRTEFNQFRDQQAQNHAENKEELTRNTKLTLHIASRIDKLHPEVMAKVAKDYEDRAAVRTWIKHWFSSGTKITALIASLLVIVGALSGFVSWALTHIK